MGQAVLEQKVSFQICWLSQRSIMPELVVMYKEFAACCEGLLCYVLIVCKVVFTISQDQ
jgi:non-ribosomal peptide synthetase component E (peptide arylation enzyme)